MLNRKYENLIKILLDEDDNISAAKLASNMNISVRSVKTYVRDINELHPSCIYSDASGYFIDKKLASELLNKETTTVPQTSRERVVYIINKLIKEPLDAYYLSEILCVSLSTLKTDVTKARKMIEKYDLILQNKNDILSIDGLETNKRKLVSSILYKESNVNFVNLYAIQNNFKDIDIFFIKDVLIDVFNKNSYFINDYSLTNLVLHITIAIDRIKNNNTTISSESTPSIAQHEFKLSREICKRLENYFDILYSDSEVIELAILLMSRTTFLNYQNINENNIYDYIDNDVMNLVNKLVVSIHSFYYINLSESEFLIRFALHIKNLLIRSKNSRFSKNPLVQEIKLGCPLIYDAAVFISGIIKEEVGITINDDEIAYIALHIGSTIEAQKELQNRITVLLCCPNYYDISIKLVNSINSHFSNQLLIKNIVNNLEEVEEYYADLIISTIPSNTTYPSEFIQVNMFLQQSDIYAIENKIKSIKLDREKNEFRINLQKILSEELFEIDLPYYNQSDIIDYTSHKLHNMGYVDENFKNRVWEREKMSSTAYGNFAIPHAMKMEAKKTGIYIIISKKPIKWGGKYVQIVLTMCFNATERYIFNQVFEPITRILTTPENITLLSHCKDYKEFIDAMVSCL
ncbi:putative licABCH operon regulator [Clostridium puniceum]|uniref:Putative licABCH operon regulator n=1 Tax=Clostridium puniceum TaxID=29367 RepID=A0A1S8T7V8_9CLOT|nr:PRD domain-containing protein [Clostridium puniceum]OOM73704.1 putative licABCH operon regulator [Clostridium puniceum]